MTAKLVASSSALIAALTLATAAEAGGGVRVGFGMPLGSFVATPARGGATQDSYVTKSRSKPATARKAPKSGLQNKVAKVEPRAKPAADSETMLKKEGAASNEVDQSDASASSTTIAASMPAEAQDKATVAAAEAGDCKRFIPTVGVTISVGCEK